MRLFPAVYVVVQALKRNKASRIQSVCFIVFFIDVAAMLLFNPRNRKDPGRSFPRAYGLSPAAAGAAGHGNTEKNGKKTVNEAIGKHYYLHPDGIYISLTR